MLCPPKITKARSASKPKMVAICGRMSAQGRRAMAAVSATLAPPPNIRMSACDQNECRAKHQNACLYKHANTYIYIHHLHTSYTRRSICICTPTLPWDMHPTHLHESDDIGRDGEVWQDPRPLLTHTYSQCRNRKDIRRLTQKVLEIMGRIPAPHERQEPVGKPDKVRRCAVNPAAGERAFWDFIIGL